MVYNVVDGERERRAQGVCGRLGGGDRASAHMGSRRSSTLTNTTTRQRRALRASHKRDKVTGARA